MITNETKNVSTLLLALLLASCSRTPETAAPATQGPDGPRTGEVAATESRSQGQGATQLATYVDPGVSQASEEVQHAVAVLAPTAGNTARGVVNFRKEDGQLTVTADMHGLPPGKHAYHVHLLGDCSSDDGKSAGTHFNFVGPSEDKTVQRITGNLGELDANDAGDASARVTIPTARLQGRFSILGRSVVVHQKGNDADRPPLGAAGSRLACGVIGISRQ
jgi:Cu-Zn family superoxide dismutase